MRLHLPILAFLLAAAAAPHSSAQQRVLPGHFAGWTAQKATFSADATRPDLLQEVGAKAPEFSDYVSGDKTIHVLLAKYRDPSSAYQIYTSELTSEMTPSTVWGPSAIKDGHLLLLVGNLVMEVQDAQNASAADLKELATAVKGRSDQSPLPPVRTYLAEGFADGTQRYVLGPVGFQAALESLHQREYSVLTPEVGFQSGAEAMLAQYRRGKESAALVLILYPTPQLAEQHLRHLESVLPPAAKQAGAKIERNASLLSLILAPTSAAYATDLRNAINYTTQVTWHEPTHTITDPPLTTTIAKIILATFLLMVIAVVLGVAFGGVRLLTKIFFPGKVFDRPDQLDVLQLGLSSKRIDSRDFY
jgi:hypothetical protein